jgi:hypothetical protein
VIGSGNISLLLLFHYIFQGEYSSDEESKRIRISGRHFMLSIISLTSLLALESLIFCMVENWTYLDAICEYTSSSNYACQTDKCTCDRLLGGHYVNQSGAFSFSFSNLLMPGY